MTTRLLANRRPSHRFARGMMLAEIVLVTLIASIVSAYAVPRLLPTGSKSTAGYQAQKLADNLRHTRMLALAWGKSLVFETDAVSYRVTCSIPSACANATPVATRCPNPTAVVIDHGHHGPFCVALEGGLTLAAPAAVTFDTLGRPISTTALSYQLLSGNAPIATVTLAPFSGFVTAVVAP